jgi:hypothetical protein
MFKQCNISLKNLIRDNISFINLVKLTQTSKTYTQDNTKTFTLNKGTDIALTSKINVNKFASENLAYYLAGLIEGEGNIYIPSNKRYPGLITISFNSKDYPLIAVIQSRLGEGNIYKIKGKNSYSYTIGNLIGLIKIANIINGKMRTPKIIQLYTLIDYLNDKLNNLPINKIMDNNYFSIKKLPLDTSDLGSNA